MSIIIDDLFNEVLINPVNNGGNNLFIVSGYATSAMAFHHLNYLKSKDIEINVNLIVGMCPTDGMSQSNHKGFQKLANEDFSERFLCNYITNPPSVHSKVYAWFQDDRPISGFIGSANYTQNAFSNRQKETLGICDPLQAKNYFDELESNSIYCNHPDTDSLVKIYSERVYARRKRIGVEMEEIETGMVEPVEELESIRVSLLDRNNEIHRIGGLNWGQRPNRNPNEAYIQLRPDVYRSNFFPLRSIHFTVLTDDNKILICTRAAKNEVGTQIETPQNNSLLGEYFRNRLNLTSGVFVTKQDLENYGRTDVTFYKIDDETFYLDFSV